MDSSFLYHHVQCTFYSIQFFLPMSLTLCSQDWVRKYSKIMLVAHLLELFRSKVSSCMLSPRKQCLRIWTSLIQVRTDSSEYEYVVNMIILCYMFEYQTPSSDTNTKCRQQNYFPVLFPLTASSLQLLFMLQGFMFETVY